MEGNILHQYINRTEFDINVPPRWLISLVTGAVLVLWTLKQSLDSTDKTEILGWIFLRLMMEQYSWILLYNFAGQWDPSRAGSSPCWLSRSYADYFSVIQCSQRYIKLSMLLYQLTKVINLFCSSQCQFGAIVLSQIMFGDFQCSWHSYLYSSILSLFAGNIYCIFSAATPCALG